MLLDLTTTTLVEWSRWQFAMTAIYHYMFVPLTLGLALMLAIMETMWVKTGNISFRARPQGVRYIIYFSLL